MEQQLALPLGLLYIRVRYAATASLFSLDESIARASLLSATSLFPGRRTSGDWHHRRRQGRYVENALLT